MIFRVRINNNWDSMIILEEFNQEDFNQLIAWINSDELLTHWSGNLFSFPLTEKSLRWYVTDTNEIKISDAFIYKAVDTDLGKAVGHISLGGVSYKNESARISRVFVDPSQKGKGICQ